MDADVEMSAATPATITPPAEPAPPPAEAPSAPPAPAPPAPAPATKPKSTHKQRSPSPPPPRPPPPLRTIRLQIKLGGADNYEVDINALAIEAGQKEEWMPDVRPEQDTSESESDDDEPESPDGMTAIGKRKKRKNMQQEYYDINDPFIDDSELAIDDRKFIAETKQKGFYVSSGQVALVKEKEKPVSAKPRIKLSSNPIAVTTAPPRGTRDTPIAVDALEDDDPEQSISVGSKRKRYVTVVEPDGKRRKIMEIASAHPAVRAALEELQAAIAREDWTTKGKFPPTVKPILAKAALLAIEHDEYDDDFFNLMPTLFPYNKFTMTKLIKRTIFADHTKLLQQRQDKLLLELANHAKEGFKKAEEYWEHTVVLWDRRRLAKKEAGGAGVEGATSDTAMPSTRPPTPQGGEDKDADAAAVEKDAEPPQKKYRLTDQLKGIIWELVILSNECCRLENEKNGLEGSVVTLSEQGQRKGLYQRIVAAFPEGWMNSSIVSREVSAIKKRIERDEELRNNAQ